MTDAPQPVNAAPPPIHVPLWVSVGVFLVLFVLGRLWFFVDFPIPAVHPDSGSYFAVSEYIGGPQLPRFSDRSPFYPLLLAGTFSVIDRVMALVYVQTLLSCFAGMLLVSAVHSIRTSLAIPMAVAMGAFFVDIDALEHDTAMLTESVYTSLLIISFALLLKSFMSRRTAWLLALCSLCMAFVIYTKPGGIYLIVIYALIVAFLLYRRAPRGVVAAFATPFAAALLALASYNKATIGSFALSMSDATEITFVTNLFWETDPSYPPEINQAIVNVQQKTQARLTPEQLRLLNESWDFDSVYPLYLRGHYYDPQAEIAKVTEGWGTPGWRAWLLRLASDAIRKHPDRFLKHYLVMMRQYYFSVVNNGDFRNFLYYRIDTYYVQKHFSKNRDIAIMPRMAKEFADPESVPRAIRITDFDKSRQMDLNQRIYLEDTALTKIYLRFLAFSTRLFSSRLWSLAQGVVLVAALVVFVRARGRHDGAFLLLILVLAVLGNASVVSLVEFAQSRYSYPLEWVYYTTVIGLPLLTRSKKNLLPAAH
jgi:hypothetical protein